MRWKMGSSSLLDFRGWELVSFNQQRVDSRPLTVWCHRGAYREHASCRRVLPRSKRCPPCDHKTCAPAESEIKRCTVTWTDVLRTVCHSRVGARVQMYKLLTRCKRQDTGKQQDTVGETKCETENIDAETQMWAQRSDTAWWRRGGTRERGGAENITRRNKRRQAEVFWERGRKEEGFRWRQNKNVEKRKAGRSADAERSLGKTTTVHCKR